MPQGRAAAPRWALSVPPGAHTPGARTLAVLSGEHTDGGTHELVASALTGLLQAGWSDADACRAVEQSPGLSWRVGDEQRRGWRWLMRLAEVQRAWVAEHPASDYAPEVREQVTAARQQLHSWAPDDALRERLSLPRLDNLRAVGDALLVLADELGRLQHLSVGVRELAERAGVAVGTARKALSAWRAVGLLVQVEPSRWVDGVQLAATYRLEPAAVVGDSASEVLVSSQVSATVGHDAWRQGGLGHGAWVAWGLLHPDEHSDPDELAQLLGVTRRTVLRRLERLELHRLVTRTAYGWLRCSEQDAVHLLELAAVHEQTDGAGERQRARHAAERQLRQDQRRSYVEHLREQHRRERLEHAVREPDELVPVAQDGWVPLGELVGQLRERGDGLARERAPAGSWHEPDELALPELVSQLAAAGQAVRVRGLDKLTEQAQQLSDELTAAWAPWQAFAEQLQQTGAAVARWAAEHEHELTAERARQGVQSG